jgi:tRNA-5-methyluridine54 2-sulfurtransferase
MKCRKCEQKAVINMRQHKLALCQQHFLEWVPLQVQHAIEKYRMFTPTDRVLVAVSGGKDSLSLWDILQRLGYQADGIYIGLGIDANIHYSDESQRLTEEFAAAHGLNLHVVSVPGEYGAGIPQITARSERGRQKPCAVCGLTKRHIMNRVARDGDYQVLVTGHNLDDEAAVLMGNTLNWLPGYLVRQGPVLEANHAGLARKAKPLCRMYEREMTAYAMLSRIEYIYDECPYAYGSRTIYYKEMLNRLEVDRPGAKLSFYLTFLQAKEQGMFAPGADVEARDLHTCPSCGQPTTAPGECAFCRMVHKL